MHNKRHHQQRRDDSDRSSGGAGELGDGRGGVGGVPGAGLDLHHHLRRPGDEQRVEHDHPGQRRGSIFLWRRLPRWWA